MSVTMLDVPACDRPRERLLARGAEGLSERELVALLLRDGTHGVNALDLAGELLAEFGSAQALASARPEELAATKGIGPAKAAALVAAFELGRRSHQTGYERTVLRRPEDVVEVVHPHLASLRHERVVTVVCDSANGVLKVVTASDGAVDRSLVPTREILNAVLRHDGRAFAVAHNHPSGDPKPSDADTRATHDLRDAARVVGLRFLGHVIVAGDSWQAII